MIKLDLKSCSDGSYGKASFNGKTVKEVLEEIKEYSQQEWANYLGDDFGRLNGNKGFWSINVDNKIYKSSWPSDLRNKNLYHNENDNDEVSYIEVNGDYYCWYNFNIYTKKFVRKEKKLMQELDEYGGLYGSKKRNKESNL